MFTQVKTAEPLLPPCSELMLRDNLFEMVTISRTFYIQVGHPKALKETAIPHTCVIRVANAAWFSIRLTVRRTCTAGSRPSQGR